MVLRKLSVAVVVVPVMLVGGASCTTADALCELICECEHCSDLAENELCESLALDQEIAEIYGCDSAWESWAECVENNGSCREDDAVFTTSELDYCASFIDLGIPCSGDAECAAQPDAFCNQGTCMRRSCNSNPQQPCNSDSDCPTGTDLCADVRQALVDCEQAAAGIVIGGGVPTQPGPGPDQ